MKSVMTVGVDLGYLSTGLVRAQISKEGKPRAIIDHWAVIEARPQRLPKRERSGLEALRDPQPYREREATAFRQLTQQLRYGVRVAIGVQAVIYEMPLWAGGAKKRGAKSTAAVLGLGRAEARLLLALQEVAYWDTLYSVEPAQWQLPWCGVYPQQTGKGEMKRLTRQRLAAELEDSDHPILESEDACDAAAIAIQAGLWILGDIIGIEEGR